MAWIQLRLTITPNLAEPLEDLLLASGACAVTFEDAKDQPLYEPDLGTTPLWNETGLIGLFEADTDMEAIVSELKENFEAETGETLPAVKVEILEDKDWEREWLKNFHPMQFGSRLWICPSWQAPPQPDAVNLRLDPGLAFGTGTHPTTALCLRWLDAQDLDGKTVMDYGCGSGILGIAALLLGAKQATGVDTDPQALEASRDNAQRNEIEDARFDLYLPDDRPAIEVDVMVANILAQPLMMLAESIAKHTRSGGLIALSGILAQQADEVLQVYRQWFTMDAPTQDGDWVRLTGHRL